MLEQQIREMTLLETYRGPFEGTGAGATDSTNQMTNPTQDVSPLVRMRCPTCRKLFSVELIQLQQVPVQPPRFECVGCQTRFAVLMPLPPGALTADTFVFEAVSTEIPRSGSLVTPPSVERRPVERVPISDDRDCPKCGTKNPVLAKECGQCGIVFDRFKPGEGEKVADEIQLAGSLELIALWKDVLGSYSDEAMHEKFVAACFQAESLPFASHKYARILSVTPDEEIAKRMRKRIIALASQRFEFRGTGLGWKFRVPRFNGMIIFLGSMVTTIGLLLPNAHNVTGIGISMLALALGVRFVLRRSE